MHDLSIVRSGSWAYVLQWFCTEDGWSYPRVMHRVKVLERPNDSE